MSTTNPAVPETVDTLIHARWVIPVRPAGTVLEQHSVAIINGRIVGIAPTEEARKRWIGAEEHNLSTHALIPGLINLHTHAAMSLMRGLADDLPLMEWLQNHIWPTEAKHVSERFVRDGTLLACAEMIAGGTTCFNDMYFFPAAAAEAVRQTGMRAILGITVLDFPTAYATDADDYLSKGLEARDALRDTPLVSWSLAPHAPYTVGDKTFVKILKYADQLELAINIHLHETEDEIRQSLADYGVRPLARLQNLGLVGPNFTAVHAVHLEPVEIETLSRLGSHIAHCPSSNMKLASGIAPIPAALTAGINIGLGTDGAASNNRLDMFAEMRQAAFLAKIGSGHADAVPAWQALEMATLGGARALGMEAEIGSIEMGKAADLAAINFSAFHLQPCYDPISHLVYAAGNQDVSHTWVSGRLLYENDKYVKLLPESLKSVVFLWQNELVKN